MGVDRTDIVIPVRDQLPITRNMVEQLQEQEGWDKCWIFNNGSVDGTWEYLIDLYGKDNRFCPIMASGDGIYDMWDSGFTLAKHDGADFIAIFNNDLTLFPGTIRELRGALAYNHNAWISYPDYNATEPSRIYYRETAGTYRHGGMSGFCFMLKASLVNWLPLVDPIFKWWGGDDDIAFEAEKRGGRQLRVMGLPVEHMMEGTARHHDLGAQKGADLAAVFKKWGR